jgi:predicted DNA-binding transcriptional regulator AlpA
MTSTFDSKARFLRTPEAGFFLGLSGRTLEKHRTYGTGPSYRKIGGRVVYAVRDLEDWADLGLQTATSDRSSQVRPAKPPEWATLAL